MRIRSKMLALAAANPVIIAGIAGAVGLFALLLLGDWVAIGITVILTAAAVYAVHQYFKGQRQIRHANQNRPIEGRA